MRKWLLILVIATLPGGMFGQPSLSELREMYEEGQILKVLDLLSEPLTAEYTFLKADCLHKQGSFNEAIVLYNEALLMLENNGLLNLNAAICQHSAGNYELSDKGLEAASKLMGRSPKISYYLGANRYMENDLLVAIDYLKEAIAADSSYFDAIYLLAACKAELDQREEASELYNKCAELQPEMVRVNLNRANLLFDDGRYSQALDMFSVLISSSDKEIRKEAYYFRAACRFYLHDSSGACDDWTIAAKMGDEDAREHILTQCQGKTKKLKTRKSSYNAF